MREKKATEQYLRQVDTPNHPAPYSVIPHAFIIDKVREIANKFGITIDAEIFSAGNLGNEARGFVKLGFLNDPDIECMLTWVNSYNKKIKFSCLVGGYISESDTPFVFHNAEYKWIRKHTGTAFEETESNIYNLLSDINIHFKTVSKEKDALKNKTLTEGGLAELLGKIYFTNDILSIEVASMIRRNTLKELPTNLWELFKIIAVATKELDPKKWYDTLTKTHYFFLNEYDLLISNDEEEPALLETAYVESNVEESTIEIVDEPKEIIVEENEDEIIIQEEEELEIEVEDKVKATESSTYVFISALNKTGLVTGTDEDGKVLVQLEGETFSRPFNKFMVKEIKNENETIIEKAIKERYSRLLPYTYVDHNGTIEVTLTQTSETFIL